MANLTWRQLLRVLTTRTDLDDNIIVYDIEDDEYYPVNDLGICKDGVLDDFALFLKFKGETNANKKTL